ncbi:MAG: hypothetical protein VX610_00895 [SAR324 cluster bacterium]|nr:hypothetical protein [SAR324 cluster bacterium]
MSLLEQHVESLADRIAGEQPAHAPSAPQEVEQEAPPPRPTPRPGVNACFEFGFDAQGKPITQKVLDWDRKRQHRFFSRREHASVSHVSALLEKKPSVVEMTRMLHEAMVLYLKIPEHGPNCLEVIGRLLLEAAALEQGKLERQRFLLYQALDFASMAIEVSPDRLNLTSAALCTTVFKATAFVNRAAFYIERDVQREMGKILVEKKNPQELVSRERIIRLYLQGHRYYEAFVQMLEFIRILQELQPRVHQAQQGELLFRQAMVMQRMIDFYAKVALGEQERDTIMDMGKLQSFVHRYNFRYPERPLLPLTGKSPVAIRKTLNSLIRQANWMYMQACTKPRFGNRHRAQYQIACNLSHRDETKLATKHALLGLATLKQARVQPLERARQMVLLLGLLEHLYMDQGLSEKAHNCMMKRENLEDKLRLIEAKRKSQQEAKGAAKQAQSA